MQKVERTVKIEMTGGGCGDGERMTVKVPEEFSEQQAANCPRLFQKKHEGTVSYYRRTKEVRDGYVRFAFIGDDETQ